MEGENSDSDGSGIDREFLQLLADDAARLESELDIALLTMVELVHVAR